MSQLFASGGQSIVVSASTAVQCIFYHENEEGKVVQQKEQWGE